MLEPSGTDHTVYRGVLQGPPNSFVEGEPPLELPLSIAECAYDVALLGAEAAQHAARGGAEDAAAAAILAAP